MTFSAEQQPHLSREVGAALAVLAQLPLPIIGTGYSPIRDFNLILWGGDLHHVISCYLQIGRRAQRVIPAYQIPFFTESLRLVEQYAAVVDAQPRLLFHEDISNVAIDQGKLSGFYDLEMCRVGTAALQLGVVLGICGRDAFDWQTIVTEYQIQTHQRFDKADFAAILAMKLFYHLIRICRWGEWDGDPSQSEHVEASAADAAWHLRHMRDACSQMQGLVDIDAWFPSLR